MFGRLAMGFANVRAGTRVLMLVLVQAAKSAAPVLEAAPLRMSCSVPHRDGECARGTALHQPPALVLEYPPEH